jgi:hypothetical protein
LCTVTDWAADVAPTTVAANVNEVGVAVNDADVPPPVGANTSRSDSWAAGHPVFPVIAIRTYRTVVVDTVMFTVFAEVGSNTDPVGPANVVNVAPSTEPCTDRVWVRAPQDAGSFKVTRPTCCADPRSTCTHCGNALLALSQYVDASASVTFPATNDPFVELADAGRPAATFDPDTTAPVPDKLTVSEGFDAFDAMVRTPVRGPDADGWNVTDTEHEAPAASDEQLFVWVKSPLAATDDTVAAALPVLLTVTFCAALGEPTVVEANVSDEGAAARVACVPTEPIEADPVSRMSRDDEPT